MITILDKQDCCGCSACIQVCPKQCITMLEDEEGFSYPLVNQYNCIDCHLCEKVCPVLHLGKPRKPLNVYAAKNRDEKIRLQSSSGGVFTVLAEAVINAGGVVFGAKFDEEWKVVHGYTETKNGIADFRGSKYVQSCMGDNFSKVKYFLDNGRKVLFSGTPCQVAGLKLFLRKPYENLLTVDFICHGVPSPKVWRMYLNEVIMNQSVKSVSFGSESKKNISVVSITFRNKCLGWKNFSCVFTFSVSDDKGEKKIISSSEVFSKNAYMKGFLENLYLRPACHHCPAKCLSSGSDITIADFWGMNKVLCDKDDDLGYSVLMVNSINTSLKLIAELDTTEIGYEDILRYNSPIEKSADPDINRNYFFSNLEKKSLSLLIPHALYRRRLLKLIYRIRRKINLLLSQ
ncbi:Coenzyme F420 hydrogenase/dehydrogenase, beta subunit C-terminal domain [Bacteroides clarus]|uniref:4Fe-4S dicluster domain-containing protein n=1 Tax=Bacteroides clarus TaxID=626929 RepID=A0A1Y3YVR5_9BACE|nr:Coenzyme F420 hydrogenase/dehydrogenase, beta subunit C-terminal domain [Bacteroides clarus]OUO01452.1 F420H(2):quinone oxidoreductase [Bacteroides clarus]RGV38646.1 4Fe-4S dicluster domain-containing protein [Bacteroides clarus]RGV58567.1 4Fe-4S dicluster domain-containing protein [Bacteroides clarus]